MSAGTGHEQETNEKAGEAVPEKALFYFCGSLPDRCLFVGGVQKLDEFFLGTVI